MNRRNFIQKALFGIGALVAGGAVVKTTEDIARRQAIDDRTPKGYYADATGHVTITLPPATNAGQTIRIINESRNIVVVTGSNEGIPDGSYKTFIL